MQVFLNYLRERESHTLQPNNTHGGGQVRAIFGDCCQSRAENPQEAPTSVNAMNPSKNNRNQPQRQSGNNQFRGNYRTFLRGGYNGSESNNR